jgi:hypothetical protein
MDVRHDPIDLFMHRVDRTTVLSWVGVERVTSQRFLSTSSSILPLVRYEYMLSPRRLLHVRDRAGLKPEHLAYLLFVEPYDDFAVYGGGGGRGGGLLPGLIPFCPRALLRCDPCMPPRLLARYPSRAALRSGGRNHFDATVNLTETPPVREMVPPSCMRFRAATPYS